MSENEEELFGFKCSHCQAEIEVSLDLIGKTIECPACGQKTTVPQPPAGAIQQGEHEMSPAMLNAQKGRTIRIDLGSLF